MTPQQHGVAASIATLTPPHDVVAQTVESMRISLEMERDGIDALTRALEGDLGIALAKAVMVIESTPGSLIVTGMGKSGHIGRKLAATFSSTGTRSLFLHPAEASHGDLGIIGVRDVVLALSWSGETQELSDIVAYTRRFGVPLIAITSQPASALGGAADIGLHPPVLPEACRNGLAPTTSTTMQLALGDALAVLLMERRDFSASDFQRYHPGGKLGARLIRARKVMHTGDEMPLVPDSTILSRAILEMTSKRFGIVGVVDGAGLLIGTLTDGDLRRAFKNGFFDRPVTEAMGRKPHIVRTDALAGEVLAQMNSFRITSIFVVEDERPIGLIHVHDLLQAGVA